MAPGTVRCMTAVWPTIGRHHHPTPLEFPLKRFFQITTKAVAVALLMASIAALSLLLIGQFLPGIGEGTISFDGHNVMTIDSAYRSGPWQALVMWLALTAAFTLAAMAFVLAICAATGALAFAALCVGLVALVLASPLLLLAGAAFVVARVFRSATNRIQPIAKINSAI